MLTAAQRSQWRRSRDELDAHLITALDQVLVVLEQTPNPADRAAILAAVPDIVTAHGNMNAQLASEFYRLARVAAGFPDNFMPTPVFDVPRDAIAASARWAMETHEGRVAADWLRASMLRHARRGEAQTILAGTGNDPDQPRMRRVPAVGACPWCMMLATRGYVYTGATALRASDGTKYHDRCKCTAEQQYRNEPPPAFLTALEEAWEKTGKTGGEEAFYEYVLDGGLGDRDPKGPPKKPGRPRKE